MFFVEIEVGRGWTPVVVTSSLVRARRAGDRIYDTYHLGTSAIRIRRTVLVETQLELAW